MEIENQTNNLYQVISQLIIEAKSRVAITANTELAMLYYSVGVYINKFVLEGNRAVYGKQIIANLSLKRTENFGKGWSEKQLLHCLRSAESFTEE